MRVGALEETITVTGEAPIVDVQTVTQQRVMDKDVLDAIPSGRSHFTATVLMPGVVTTQPDVGGANSLALTNMSIHGGTTSDTRVIGGRRVDPERRLDGNSSNYMTNMGTTQEITVDYAAGSAEQAYAGAAHQPDPSRGRQRIQRLRSSARSPTTRSGGQLLRPAEAARASADRTR